MANKPRDPETQDKAPPKGDASSDIRTKQETEAKEAKRKTETDLAEVQGQAASAPPHKTHPKIHREQETGAIQDTSDEPVVEDEP